MCNMLLASHPDCPESLNELTSALSTLLHVKNQLLDINESTLLFHEALIMSWIGFRLSVISQTLANVLHTQFWKTGQVSDLDEVIDIKVLCQCLPSLASFLHANITTGHGVRSQASACCSLTDGAPAIQCPCIEAGITTMQKLWREGVGFPASNTTLSVSILHVPVEVSLTCLQVQLAAIRDEGSIPLRNMSHPS